MFQPNRAIEILSPSRGSAYRIGGRIVLTAKHLVENSAIAQVQDKKSFGKVHAAIAWVAPNADIALLELPGTVDPIEPVALGQLPEARAGETIPFQMYGWPQWGTTLRTDEKRAAGGRHVDGTIYLADTSPDGLLVIEPQRIPFGVSSSDSDWVGMSGAAVICDGLLIAVQSAHQNSNRPQSLEATPITAIAHDLQWQALLQKHGIEIDLAISKVKLAKTSSTLVSSSKSSINLLSSQHLPNAGLPKTTQEFAQHAPFPLQPQHPFSLFSVPSLDSCFSRFWSDSQQSSS